MEIRRFGVGNRRPDGPPRTTGVAGQVIHSDARGTITELAFARRASVEPHSNPNTTWLVVIEGGGWVQVGDEQARVAAGEAVLWPADVVHGAWTELSEMRAFVVEYAGADDAHVRGLLEGRAVPLPAGDGGRAAAPAGPAPADGGLAQPSPDAARAARAAAEGEPL
jgi:quercetin dioxygenase-like cupin family protein